MGERKIERKEKEIKMRQPRIIAIGDAVCDKYLSRGKMYPGGQCVNTCAYAHMNNAESAFLGKFGNDEVAECIQAALKNMNVDFSHSRNYEGENEIGRAHV